MNQQSGTGQGPEPATTHRPGDVVNGHVLTAGGQWVPTGQPGSAAAGSAPSGGAPSRTRKPVWKRWWFLALVLVAVVVVAVNLGGGDDSAGAGDDSPAQGQGAPDAQVGETADDEGPAAPAGIGDAVRDGKFEFTVTEVEPGVARIGDDMFGEDAQGQFVLVHLLVSNIGDEAQYFDGSSQQLTDSEGRRHSADGSAAIYLDDSNSFLNQINPGNQVEGIVVFDIPADAELTSLTLHDSAFSGGVEVALG